MCIDIDESKIEGLKNWIIPIHEAWLEEIVVKNSKNWNLKFSSSPEEWIKFWEVIFSAVWTPEDIDKRADLRFVKAVAKTFWEFLNEEKILINKSTVPVWTWEICKEIISNELVKRWVKIDFDVASNPEFLREWCAVFDFLNPDRIIVWIDNKKSEKIISEIYKPFTKKGFKLMITDTKSSEIIKYASNSFLATKISFINEIANFVELAWWNINDISTWMGLDPRIWPKFLNAWIGYWWSCFPKDVSALIQTWKDFGYDFKIISATDKVNHIQQKTPIYKLNKALDWKLVWKKIAIWGLSYKPETDDIREAPSIEIIKDLADGWVSEINAYDPICWKFIKNRLSYFNNLEIFDDKYEAIYWADALIILTEWSEFKEADIKKIKEKLAWNIVIDGRNIFNKDELEKIWINYIWVWIK